MTIPNAHQTGQAPAPDPGVPVPVDQAAVPPHGQPERVQSDTLLSQPEPDANQGYGPVGEEISLDQQSAQARKVGQAPADAATEQAIADALRPDGTAGAG